MLDLRFNDELYTFLKPTSTSPTYYISNLRRYIRHFHIPDSQLGIAMKIAFSNLLNRLDRNKTTVIEARDMLIEALDAIHAMCPNDFRWRRDVYLTIDGVQYHRSEENFADTLLRSQICTCMIYPTDDCSATFHPGVI